MIERGLIPIHLTLGDDQIFDAQLIEPDCYPHPLDVMAMFALYQTVD